MTVVWAVNHGGGAGTGLDGPESAQCWKEDMRCDAVVLHLHTEWEEPCGGG